MTERPPVPDSLRADFIEILWAYIDGTKAGVMEWPPQSVDSQPTPIDAKSERAFLFEIAGYATALRRALGDRDGPAA